MYLSDTQGNQPINSKTVPSVSGTVPEAPGIYCSDGDSYESCLETIGGDEGDNASEIYTDTVDALDHSGVKYLNTWLWFSKNIFKQSFTKGKLNTDHTGGNLPSHKEVNNHHFHWHRGEYIQHKLNK